MGGFVQFCLGSLCVFTPILFLIWTGLVYGLGIGSIKIPGIGREKIVEGK